MTLLIWQINQYNATAAVMSAPPPAMIMAVQLLVIYEEGCRVAVCHWQKGNMCFVFTVSGVLQTLEDLSSDRSKGC